MAHYKTMTDGRVIVTGNSWSPEFIQELLPPVERTALFYHLSYLCLGKFPKLERLIREQAVETRMVFNESEGVLIKCAGTSSNLVESLFPMLTKVVEANKPTLAVKFLEKASAWINDIIRASEHIVNRYKNLNQSMAHCIGEVILEKKETEQEVKKLDAEVKILMDIVEKLEEELIKNTKLIEETERKIQEKSTELQKIIAEASKKRQGHDPGLSAKVKSLIAELDHLSTEKTRLQKKEWSIQVELADHQLRLSRHKIDLGVIPDPIHLKDAHKSLYRIQNNLHELQNFWVNVGSLLETLKDKMFVEEILSEDVRMDLIDSIKVAQQCWVTFGECCQRVHCVFSVQSRDAYRFLEINPSTLSQEAWDKEYKSIMEKVKRISPVEPTSY